jgi:hypothetical protein
VTSKENAVISRDKILKSREKQKEGEISIEVMAKHIAQLKRPMPPPYSNPFNGNSLY